MLGPTGLGFLEIPLRNNPLSNGIQSESKPPTINNSLADSHSPFLRYGDGICIQLCYTNKKYAFQCGMKGWLLDEI